MRRRLAVLGVGVLLLGTVGANPAPSTGDGRSLTELQLLRLALTDVPLVSDTSVVLGTLSSLADGAGAGAAQLLFEGAAVGEDSLAARRFEGSASGDETLDLGGLGTLSLLDYAVTSGPRDATAQLGALTGGVDLPILDGLQLTLGEAGLGSIVTEDATTSVTSLRVDGLGLDVGDLLGGSILDELPLGLLLDLLDDLPITLPTDLADAVATLEALPGQLQAALDLEDAALESLDDLLDALDVLDLDDALSEIAALEALVAGLEAEEAGLLDELALVDSLTVDQLLAALVDLGTTHSCDLLDLPNLLACLQDELTAALDAALVEVRARLVPLTAELAAAEVLLDALEGVVGELTALLDRIAGQLGLLPDLASLRDDLAGLLADASLFDIGDLVVGVATGATSDGGTAAVTCELGELSVLGRSPLTDLECGALDGAFAPVEALLGDLLAGLPGVAPLDAPASISLGGLEPSATTDDGGRPNGRASVTALATTIGSVELADVLDGLTGTLDDLTGDLTEVLGGLELLGLLDGALGGVAPAGASAAAVPVLDDLTGLLGQLDGLPLGDGLGGLSTLGLDLELAGLSAASAFAPDPATTPPDTDDPDPEGPGSDAPDLGDPDGGDPSTGAPPTPQPTGTTTPVTPATTNGGGDLPRTGGGVSLLGLAMLLAATVPRVRRA